MGLLDRLTGQPDLAEALDETRAELAAVTDMAELYQERLVELEFALEDQGWQLLRGDTDRELSREALRVLCRLARLHYLKNPLIRRGVRVKAFYVFAQGVQLSADDEAVNDWIRDLTDDLGNRRALFGHQARGSAETDLQLDGNLLVACFTDPSTGRVRVRRVSVDEVDDIVANPDDRSQPWLYRRRSQVTRLNVATGATETVEEIVWHPAMWVEPHQLGMTRGDRIAGAEVRWDAPIYHVKVGGRDDMRFGVPEVYAALDWAKAYREFLEDWATLVRALSRFAFKLTSPGRKLAANKAKLSTTLDSSGERVDANPPPPAGSTIGLPEGTNLEAIPKTGATVSAEDGKQLRLMVASAMDLPDTLLSGDADQGNHATAETMDRPTELGFMDRQQLWSEIFRDLLTYMVAAAIRAPRGPIEGTVEVDGDNVAVTLSETGEAPAFTVDWPPILQPDIASDIEALVNFATLNGKAEAGTVPTEALARRGMTILGFDDVDDLVAALADQADQAGAADDPEVAAQLEQVAEAARRVVDVLEAT